MKKPAGGAGGSTRIAGSGAESPAADSSIETLARDPLQAFAFSRVILNDEPTEFRCIHPNDDTKRPVSFWGVLNDEQAFKVLEEKNAEGYGIFAVINRLDPSVEQRTLQGKAGRDRDVTGIRALFVDIDREENEAGENLRRLQTAPLRPTLITQTSHPYKLQAYWLADGVSVSEFKTLQKTLIDLYGADPQRKNASSVMRIPGFFHTKRTPVLCRILEVNE